MRAVQITEYLKGPQDLRVSNLPDPKPSPDEYLIAIHAASTNFFDLLQIRGIYQHQPPFPWISGAEFAGTVLSTPSSIPSPKHAVGARVFGATQGAFATHICAKEAALRPVPPGWTFQDAAGLMVTAPTSYAGLVIRAGIKKGDYVLVHAAAGGVGLAAVQIAKAFGATVIATAGSARKLQVAKSFGADHCLNYRTPGWESEVKTLTPDHRGVDIVYDPVGLVNPSLKCTAWNGRILVIGFAAGAIEKVPANRLLLKNVSVLGLHWGMYDKEEPDVIGEVWRGLGALMKDGRFRGTAWSDESFVGLESVGMALGMLARRETWGKVVITVPQAAGGSKI